MDLLQTTDQTVVCPWLGGRAIRIAERKWTLQGALPQEHGWFAFHIAGRQARDFSCAEPEPSILSPRQRGYLVGDRLVVDDSPANTSALALVRSAPRVWLIEQGLDRFTRVVAGAAFSGGPLVYISPEMPLGCEDEVLSSFLDRTPNVSHIPGVSPSLDAAFQIESWRRSQAEWRLQEVNRQQQLEQAQREQQERERAIAEQLGSGAGRRHIAREDFRLAAEAALTVGGAVYLDHRPSHRRSEMVVRFRLSGRAFECTCDQRSLQIIDAGICLTDESTGEKGDSLFTLESLPSVILEADRTGKLVVFRHVG